MCAVVPCQSWGCPGRTTPSIRADRRADPPRRRPPDHLRSSAGDAVGAIGPERADDHGHGQRLKVETRCQWVGVGARRRPKMPGRGTCRGDINVAAGKPGADKARSPARRGDRSDDRRLRRQNKQEGCRSGQTFTHQADPGRQRAAPEALRRSSGTRRDGGLLLRMQGRHGFAREHVRFEGAAERREGETNAPDLVCCRKRGRATAVQSDRPRTSPAHPSRRLLLDMQHDLRGASIAGACGAAEYRLLPACQRMRTGDGESLSPRTLIRRAGDGKRRWILNIACCPKMIPFLSQSILAGSNERGVPAQ